MALIEILTLGGFQVRHGGEPVDGFDSDTVRLLLAYLAVEAAHPLRRETLASLFWPEAPPPVARTNLRWALSNLRKVIGDRTAETPFLLVDRQTIQRNPAARYQCDAISLLSFSQHTEINIDQLETLTRLYRGEFLAGLNPRDSLPLDEWLLIKREQLTRLLAEILERLIHCYLLKDDFRIAIPHARQLVELEPWQERGHRLLMRLLDADGQRNAALEQYQHYKTFVTETLGVEPEEETIQLYERIRRKDGSKHHPAQHNLTCLMPALVGRQEELEALQTCLLDPGCRSVTITGLGGIGKTHLAIEAARTQIENYRDGVYFVDLRSVGARQSIIPAIAEALTFPFVHGDDLPKQLLDYLADKELLLVLDNFEHLQEQTGTAVLLLGRTQSLKLILTSRVRLNIPGGQTFPLSGLALPTDADSVSRSSAVQLFLDATRRVNPGYQPSPIDLTSIVEICRLADGLPLGILLAAAWIEIMSPAEIAAAICRNYEVLETEWEGISVHHRSIRAVLQSSWGLLDDRTQQALAALSVFRGDFTRQAAREVSGASLISLQHLIGQSLLNWSPTGRLQLHELLRQFAAERLARTPQKDYQAHAAHSHHFLNALTQWTQELKGADQNSALDRLRAAHPNILAAWDWAVDHGEFNQLLPVVDGLCWYQLWRVLYAQGALLCQTSLTAIEASGELELDVRRLRIRLLTWQGRFHQLLREKEAGRASLDAAQAGVDQLLQGGENAEFERGLIDHMRGKSVESQNRPLAETFYMYSLTSFRQNEYCWEAAHVLSSLGSVAWNLGQYTQAADCHQQALDIRLSLEDTRGIAASSMALGIILLEQGHFTEALARVEEGYRLRRQLKDRLGIADSLRNLGWTRMLGGDFEKAVALLDESVSIYQSLGLRYGLEMSMLAAALAHWGDFENAGEWSRCGLETARATGYYRALAQTLLTCGELALADGDFDQARQTLTESLAVHQKIGQAEGFCRVWIALALLEIETGNHRKAEKALNRAQESLRSCRAFTTLLYLLPAMAKWYGLHGETTSAMQCMRPVLDYAFVRESCWFRRVLGDVIHGNMPKKEDPDPAMLWETFEVQALNPPDFEKLPF